MAKPDVSPGPDLRGEANWAFAQGPPQKKK